MQYESLCPGCCSFLGKLLIILSFTFLIRSRYLYLHESRGRVVFRKLVDLYACINRDHKIPRTLIFGIGSFQKIYSKNSIKKLYFVFLTKNFERYPIHGEKSGTSSFMHFSVLFWRRSARQCTRVELTKNCVPIRYPGFQPLTRKLYFFISG
jgi:hypothetical protein